MRKFLLLLAVLFAVAWSAAANAEAWTSEINEHDRLTSIALVEGERSIMFASIHQPSAQWRLSFLIPGIADGERVSLIIRELDGAQTVMNYEPGSYLVTEDAMPGVAGISVTLTPILRELMSKGVSIDATFGTRYYTFSLLQSFVVEDLIAELETDRLALLDDIQHGAAQAESDCMQAAMRGEGMIIDCAETVEIAAVNPKRVDELLDVVSWNECRLTDKVSQRLLPGVGFDDPGEIDAITARLFYYDMARLRPTPSGGAVLEVFSGPCPARSEGPSLTEQLLTGIAEFNCSVSRGQMDEIARDLGIHLAEVNGVLPYLRNDGSLVVWDGGTQFTMTEDACSAYGGQHEMQHVSGNARQTPPPTDIATSAPCQKTTDADERVAACTRNYKAAESHSRVLEALYLRATAYQELGFPDLALADLEEAIEKGVFDLIGPDDTAEVLMAKAQVHSDLGQYDDAIDAYSRIIDLNNWEEARLARADSYVETGALELARDDLAHVVFSVSSSDEARSQAADMIKALSLTKYPFLTPDEIVRELLSKPLAETLNSQNPYMFNILAGALDFAETQNVTSVYDQVILGGSSGVPEVLSMSTTVLDVQGSTASVSTEIRSAAGVRQLHFLFSPQDRLWKLFDVLSGDDNLLDEIDAAVTGTDAPSTSNQTSETADVKSAVASEIIHDCDWFAAHPADAEAVVAAGVPYDDIIAEQAIRVCEQANSDYPGTARFHFQLGRAYDKAGRYGDAHREYRAAADLEYAIAMNNIAYQFRHGEGVPQDAVRSAIWYERAAEAAHAPAMSTIAKIYANGTGFPKDVARALHWFTMAARFGDASAMNTVGHYHWNGIGTVRDLNTAREWLELATEKGNAIAPYNLAILHDEPSLSGQRNAAKSARLLLLAIARGNQTAYESMSEHSRNWSSDTMKAVQAELRDRGFYSGSLDGRIGPQTMAAVDRVRDG